MKFSFVFIGLVFSALAATSVSHGRDFPVLEGPYMGQPAPGMTAEVFAPGVVSTEAWELEAVFAPGMREFYFTTKGGKYTVPTIVGFRQENNIWKKYIEFSRTGEVTFSPDGKRMHMAKGYKERVGSGWSERKSLGPMFEREDWGVMRLSASTRGTYVFDDYKSGDVIRISTLVDGKRQEPQMMGPVVNTGEWTAHPFIAPDESYLIWDSEREGGFGASDLYISFRQENGSWGPAINMGDTVNSDKWDAYASVTPDGKYILFNRGVDPENNNVDIYWVSASIIDELRPKDEHVSSETIEEIVVYGEKSLIQLRLEMYKAEDKAYDLFNSLNSDDEFDIHCYMEAPTGSHIKRRVCRANFVVEATSDAARNFLLDLPVTSVWEKIELKNKLLQKEMEALVVERPEFFNALSEFAEANQALKSEHERRCEGRVICGK